jgi:hypothetical protein
MKRCGWAELNICSFAGLWTQLLEVGSNITVVSNNNNSITVATTSITIAVTVAVAATVVMVMMRTYIL